MTEAQMLLILGTIWVAPHIKELQGNVTGCILLILAACKGLGWI